MSSSNGALMLVAAAAFVVGTAAHGAEDLAALQVQGLRGQSADQTRRDRYECHNWAVDQSGETPVVAAAIGAATAGRSRKGDDAAVPEGPSDYLRALTACLEGRGYSVALPNSTAVTASR